jgi:hypothetical protein
MTLVSGSRCEHAIRIGCRLVALAARQVPRDNSARQPNRASIGTTVTTIGALLLTCAIAVLVYGLFTAH